MTDGTEAPEGLQANSPAVAETTEHMIPKSRMDELNTRMKAAEAEAARLRVEAQTQRDSELTEQKRYQELAESRGVELEAANAKATKVDALEAVLQQTIDARIEDIPENLRDLVPSHGTAQERLAWLNENAAKLTMPQAPDLDGGKGGKGGTGKALPALTPMELRMAKAAGMTPDEYAKIKNDRSTGSTEQNETLNLLDEAGLLTG